MSERRLTHLATFEDATEAEQALAVLQRRRLRAELYPPAPGESGLALVVDDEDAAMALQILQALEDDAPMQLVEEPAPVAIEKEPLQCPRCMSAGVEVGGPPGWAVFLFQQVFTVPHLKSTCTCQSCGYQWRQYT